MTGLAENAKTALWENWILVLCAGTNLWMHAWYPALLCLVCVASWMSGRWYAERGAS